MVFTGNTSGVKVLIECGACPDAVFTVGDVQKFPFLFFAGRLGYDDIAQALLEARVDPSSPLHATSLHFAGAAGFPKVVKLLIEHGAKLDTRLHGMTPLHSACASSPVAIPGQEEVLELLLQYCKEVDIRYIAPPSASARSGLTELMGATPLFIAALVGGVRFVELLLRAGAKPNITRDDGMTPLFAAAREGHAQVVEILLRNSAKTEMSWNGLTPLCIAVQKGNADVVKSLLAHGARKDACDNLGKTVLEMAQEIDNPEITALLSGELAMPESSVLNEAARAAKTPSERP